MAKLYSPFGPSEIETEEATGCYGIRFHGKRWLRKSPEHTGPTTKMGWREFTWTVDPGEALLFATRSVAELFGRVNLRGPFEVAEFPNLGDPNVYPDASPTA